MLDLSSQIALRSETPFFRRSGVRLATVLSLTLLALAALGPAEVAAAGAWASFKGRIVVSDKEFASYSSDSELIKALRKQQKTTIAGDGAWTFHMMVFLKEAPNADKINIVYYDVSAKPREQVNFSEVNVQPDQKIVQLNGNSISKDLGFVKGHKYDVLATRIVDGKEKVYAKTTLTLK